METQLQTDPYLTRLPTSGSSPIVYASDEDMPVRLLLDAPQNAAFGIVGLDREIVWHYDYVALTILQECSQGPRRHSELIARFGHDRVVDLVRRNWLQPPDALCCEYRITTAQIEVTAHCNWACRCCPVSISPKSIATMPMRLYKTILEQIAPISTLRYITHHFYNEPTLDRYFDDRLEALRVVGLRLRLFTNGSGLTQRKIAALEHSGVLDFLVFNLPSLDRSRFREMTNSATFDKSFSNLNAAVAAGLDVRIAVNAVDGEAAAIATVNSLRDLYGAAGVQVYPTLFSDRAGAISKDGNCFYASGPLTGCAWPVHHLHVGVDGEVFLCCNDFDKREVMGSLRESTVDEILSSDAAVRLRRRIFGVEQADDNFLCRRCHDQCKDFPLRQFRPIAKFEAQAELQSAGIEK